MKRDEAMAILTEHQQEIENLGVKILSLFGSVARDEARPDSDVDILVEFESGRKNNQFGLLVELHKQLESLLGRSVDIIIPHSRMKHRLRQRVFNDAVCVFPYSNCKIYQKEVVGPVPPRDWKDRILDILEAIEKIERYIEGMNFDEFMDDEKTRDAVMRQLTIVGEAARYATPEVEANTPGIPWGQMRGLRNVLVHEYEEINLQTIWNIIKEHLQPVVPQLRRL